MKPKDNRRAVVLDRLKDQLKKGLSTGKLTHGKVLSEKEKERINKEIDAIKGYLEGKKRTKRKDGQEVSQNKEKWFIDIFSIHYGYVKNSERRKNKGKSRKKMKKQKSVAFVKSVVAQPGMILAYREGRMGISPRFHSFRMRKEEPQFI